MTQTRLSHPARLVNYVESRMELLASIQSNGAGPGNDSYEKPLNEAEAVISRQFKRVTAISCDETETIIDTLSRRDVLGKARVDRLADTILKKVVIDDCCAQKSSKHANKLTTILSNTLRKQIGIRLKLHIEMKH